MSKTYRIEELINLVDERNSENKEYPLLGINLSKSFFPSVANVIGTDLSRYKVIRKGRFACNMMHVGRDMKVPVALYSEDNEAIISPAYPMFTVSDENIIVPEYLMLFFKNSEFDREAGFYASAGIRGGFEWEDFCNITLPVPPIEEQRRIVNEYQTVERRIKNNEALIQKLEETAQAIYHHTFVEGINENNLPEGWRVGTIKDISKEIVCGKTPSTEDEDNYGSYMPFITIPDMHEHVFAITTERMLSKQGADSQANKTLPRGSVCVSCIGSAGLTVITSTDCQTNQQINTIIPIKDYYLYYAYLTAGTLSETIKQHGAGGAVLCNLSKSQFEKLEIVVPQDKVVRDFYSKVKPCFTLIEVCQKEIQHLRTLQSLLTSKLA